MEAYCGLDAAQVMQQLDWYVVAPENGFSSEKYGVKTAHTEFVPLFGSTRHMHQTHNNENSYMWQPKGKAGTKHVLSNTGRRRLNILGAMNMVNLDIVPFITEENCHKNTIMIFLDEVKKAYPTAKKITLFLDNARYQRNYEVQEYARKLGITLEFMPPYSPNLCLIERLWKFFKKKVVKNKYYETFAEFEEDVCRFFSLENWKVMKVELESLLALNFEIIKAI